MQPSSPDHGTLPELQDGARIVAPDVQNTNLPPTDHSRSVEEKMLDMLIKIYEKLDGYHDNGKVLRQFVEHGL